MKRIAGLKGVMALPDPTDTCSMSPSSEDVMKQFFREITTNSNKLKVLIRGGIVLLIGIVMIITPGPAFIVIPLGLMILAKEFHWARRMLNRLKRLMATVRRRWRTIRPRRPVNSRKRRDTGSVSAPTLGR